MSRRVCERMACRHVRQQYARLTKTTLRLDYEAREVNKAYDGALTAANEVIKEKTRTICRLRGALADLLRLWDRRERGDASWTPADVQRLAEIRALDGAGEIEIEPPAKEARP